MYIIILWTIMCEKRYKLSKLWVSERELGPKFPSFGPPIIRIRNSEIMHSMLTIRQKHLWRISSTCSGLSAQSLQLSLMRVKDGRQSVYALRTVYKLYIYRSISVQTKELYQLSTSWFHVMVHDDQKLITKPVFMYRKFFLYLSNSSW